MTDNMQLVRVKYPYAGVITGTHSGVMKYRIEDRVKKRNNKPLSGWKDNEDKAWEDAVSKLTKESMV